MPRNPVVADGALDSFEQGMVAEGFAQESDGARCQGVGGHFRIAMSGDENDGPGRGLGGKTALQFESAHARHPDIQYQAATRDGHDGSGAEKGFRRFMADRRPSCRLKQEDQRAAQGRFIVDDMNYRFGGHLRQRSIGGMDGKWRHGWPRGNDSNDKRDEAGCK